MCDITVARWLDLDKMAGVEQAKTTDIPVSTFTSGVAVARDALLGCMVSAFHRYLHPRSHGRMHTLTEASIEAGPLA